MPDTIKDGTGKGYSAKVEKESRLTTYATIEHNICHESKNQEAYTVIFKGIPGTSEVGLGSIKNTSLTKDMIIEKITLFSEDNTSNTALTTFTIIKNPTTNSGGDEIEPVNLNFSSNKLASADCLHDNEGTTLTISGGDEIGYDIIVGGGSVFKEYNDSILLKTNNTIAIKCKTENTGKKVKANICFYYVS